MVRVKVFSRLLILATAAMALLWLGAFLAVWRLRPLDRPSVAYPTQPEFGGITGINLDAAELDAKNAQQTIRDVAASGMQWVRFTLSWAEIEPARGQFAWEQADRVFAELARQPTLTPVVALNGSPAWARDATDADNPLAPPHERADFGAFAAAVAQRYGAQIRYYQVWHEPNIAPHWGVRPADPADYLGLLREAAVQLRAADSDAQIVLAALAPTTEAGPANLSDLTYLDTLYDLGGRAWFDIVAAQPYGFSAAADEAADLGKLNFARAALLHDVMIRHRDAGTPLWATAFGWNAADSGSPWGGVSEDEQARYTGQALMQARTAWPWLGPLFWAANCPARPASDPWLGFALCRPGGGMRPVADVLANATHPAIVLPVGEHPLNHPALLYSPGWRFTAAAADPSADGDSLTLDFIGTGLDLRIQGGPFWGWYNIAVDFKPANALPNSGAGGGSLVLHDPLSRTRWVTVARDLPPGRHRLQLKATGGWGQWALQGVRVTDAAARPAWAAWILLGLALLATLLWLRIAWPSRRPAAGWLQARLDAAAAWPEPLLWACAGALVLLLILARSPALDLVALGGLGLLFIVRPDLALPLIATALPFWQRPEPLLGMGLAHYEIFLWVAALALAVRMLVVRPANGLSGEPISNADAQDAHGTLANEKVMLNGSTTQSASWRVVSEASRLRARLFARDTSLSPLSLRPAQSDNRKFPGRAGSSPLNLDWPVLALLLSGLLSTIFAQEQGVAWREFRMVFLGGALFYWLITRTPWPEGRRFSPAPLLTGFLAGMVAVSLVAIWQLVTGQGRVDVEGVWRVRALYGSPNNLALVLDRAIPLALALAAFGMRTRAASQKAGPGLGATAPLSGNAVSSNISLRLCAFALDFNPIALWLALAVMLIAFVATFSKGGLLLGLPAGIGLVLLGGARQSGRRWPLWALAGFIAVAAGGLVLLFRTPRFADLFNFQSGTSFVRLRLWQGAWNMAVDHPLLGVGPDNFLYAYRTRYVLPSAWQELNLSHPHNILLDLWTRLGLVGVLAAGWALAAGWVRGWRLFKAGKDDVWPLALGLLGGLAATLAHGLIDNSLFLPDLMAIFILTLGVFERMTNCELRNGKRLLANGHRPSAISHQL